MGRKGGFASGLLLSRIVPSMNTVILSFSIYGVALRVVSNDRVVFVIFIQVGILLRRVLKISSVLSCNPFDPVLAVSFANLLRKLFN